jgi:hypothetical protein
VQHKVDSPSLSSMYKEEHNLNFVVGVGNWLVCYSISFT